MSVAELDPLERKMTERRLPTSRQTNIAYHDTQTMWHSLLTPDRRYSIRG